MLHAGFYVSACARNCLSAVFESLAASFAADEKMSALMTHDPGAADYK